MAGWTDPRWKPPSPTGYAGDLAGVDPAMVEYLRAQGRLGSGSSVGGGASPAMGSSGAMDGGGAIGGSSGGGGYSGGGGGSGPAALLGLQGAGPVATASTGDTGDAASAATGPQEAGGGMDQMATPEASFEGPGAGRQGIGRRTPPELTAMLAGLRKIY